MSHRVTIELVKRKTIYKNVEKLLKDYQSILTTINAAHIVAIFQPKVDQLKQILRQLDATVDQEYDFNISRIWSALQHDFTVLDQLNEPLIAAIQNHQIDLETAFTKWKNLAVFALEELVKTKTANLNDQVLNDKIIKIKDQLISDQLIDQGRQWLDQANIDDLIKADLASKLWQSTYQNFSDLPTVILSWEDRQAKMNQILKDVVTTLVTLGFKTDDPDQFEKGFDSYHQFAYRFKMIDLKTNNDAQLIINSAGQLFYQLGDYQGHLCEDITKQLKAILTQTHDYVLLNEKIVRDYPDNQQQVLFIDQIKKQTY